MLAYPWVETERARQMGVSDLLQCLAKLLKRPLAVAQGDRRADIVREKKTSAGYR